MLKNLVYYLIRKFFCKNDKHDRRSLYILFYSMCLTVVNSNVGLDEMFVVASVQ